MAVRPEILLAMEAELAREGSIEIYLHEAMGVIAPIVALLPLTGGARESF